MLPKLIEIIEKVWSEKRQPQNRLVKSMINLYKAIHNCHETYVHYNEYPKKENLKKWKDAINNLSSNYKNLEIPLEFYAARIHMMTGSYINTEEERLVEIDDDFLICLHKSNQSLEDKINSDSIKDEIRDFTKNNFSMEEIFEAK